MSQQIINDRDEDRAASGRNLPVVQPESPRAYVHDMTRTGRPFRTLAPFLAQLALQYDDIDVARRSRKDRLETATRRYARPVSRTAFRHEGARQDIHI